MAGENKRRHERYVKRIRLRYRSGEKDKWHSAFSQDVSVSGIYVTSSTIPITKLIDIEVIDNDVTIALKGTVIRGKKVPHRLRRMIKMGFAVNLYELPEAWYHFCLDLEQKAKERSER